MSKEHLLSITDLSSEAIRQVFSSAKDLKAELRNHGVASQKCLLAGKQLAMIFEKPSLRTKLSFDIGMNQLGGHAVYFGPEEIGLGKRESVADIARVVSSMADLIVARVFAHRDLEELAKYSKVSVINALSDLEHPCQVLTDLFTIWEARKYQDLSGVKIGYVGDGDNNVAHSLCLGAALMGMEFRCGSPLSFSLDSNIVNKALGLGGTVIQTEDPQEAVAGVDVVVTDTWVSMGDGDQDARKQTLKPYQVNSALMGGAKKEAIFMHCLPAHRGDEVTDEVIDGSNSVVLQEAENRLHVQKALLLHILGLYKEENIW